MLMKKNISFIFFITVIIFSAPDIYAQKTSPVKRIYITNFERKVGVSSEIADKIHDIIKITMLEKPGNEYRIISDDDIKVMFKKAESLQAAGCNDESCNMNIAQAIKADEIIYGNVSRNSGKINVVVYNLETGTMIKQRGAGTKSMVSVSFDEKELDWMSREIGLKLINPKYKITKAPFFDEKINITPIELTLIKKEDITAIQFTNNETSLNAIIDYYKGIADEGDILFSKKEYEDALGKYIEIIKSIQTKMTDENRKKIKQFTATIEKRISSAMTMIYKPEIEKIDQMILSEHDPSEEDYEDALEEYYNIEKDIKNKVKDITFHEYVRIDIEKILDDRQDLMMSAIISISEKRGDSFYRNYQFNDALKNYMIAKKLTVKFNYEVVAGITVNDPFSVKNNSQLKMKIEKKLDAKIDTTLATARSYLENIVNSHIDQAEYYNVTNNPDEAKESMDKALKEITGPMRKFATEELIVKYNNYASMIPRAKQIDEKSKLKVQEAIDHPESNYNTSFWNDCLLNVTCLTLVTFLTVFAVVGI